MTSQICAALMRIAPTIWHEIIQRQRMIDEYLALYQKVLVARSGGLRLALVFIQC